jgi:signal transduction histidine kinase/CheY-like chemotaxis protein
MKSVKNMSIRTKLVLLAGAAVSLALVLSSTGIIVNDITTIRSATIEQLQVQARIMAFNSDGVLTFADAKAATELLNSMSVHPAIEVACLLDAENNLFAGYEKIHDSSFELPTPLETGARLTADGHIEVVTPVVQNGGGDIVGTLYLRANTDNIATHTSAQIRYIIWVSLVSLLVATAIAAFLQNAISRPILRLTQAAQRISRDEDYSLRVTLDSTDELGTLYKSFNQMLDALKSTHDQVADQAEQLTKEVAVRTRAEAELLVAKEAAEASNRAKSEFLANMSHEIRTPLTGILGFTDLLLAGGDDGELVKRVEYLTTIQASGKHLLGVINDILDLSKIEAGRVEFDCEACRPDQVVQEVVRVLQVKAEEKGLELKVRWMGQIPETIHTDPSRVRQALLNLIGNSIKFTSSGSVTVAGRFLSFGSRPRIQIDIIDTGIGITAEQIQRIFDPFVQADNSVTRRFGGTGLGLAITRKIARGLGGDLVATSVPGAGSTFTLTIDAGDVTDVALISPAAAESPRPVENVTVERKNVLAGAEILLVEDGDTNRKLIKLLLERAGAHVTTAENGAIGCEFALRRAFDLILMDMQMPVMDGYSAARKLRESGLTLPIVALTAHTMAGDREKCLDAGCSDYLTKPINPEHMFAVIERSLPAAVVV